MVSGEECYGTMSERNKGWIYNVIKHSDVPSTLLGMKYYAYRDFIESLLIGRLQKKGPNIVYRM